MCVCFLLITKQSCHQIMSIPAHVITELPSQVCAFTLHLSATVCVHRRLISFSSVFQHLGLSLTASLGHREHLYMPLAIRLAGRTSVCTNTPDYWQAARGGVGWGGVVGGGGLGGMDTSCILRLELLLNHCSGSLKVRGACDQKNASHPARIWRICMKPAWEKGE